MSLRDHLVHDAANWKSWWSLKWQAVAAIMLALQLAWPNLPADWTSTMPVWFKTLLTCLSMLSIAVSAFTRVLKQRLPCPPAPAAHSVPTVPPAIQP
jgi:hypothetical protein